MTTITAVSPVKSGHWVGGPSARDRSPKPYQGEPNKNTQQQIHQQQQQQQQPQQPQQKQQEHQLNHQYGAYSSMAPAAYVPGQAPQGVPMWIAYANPSGSQQNPMVGMASMTNMRGEQNVQVGQMGGMTQQPTMQQQQQQQPQQQQQQQKQQQQIFYPIYIPTQGQQGQQGQQVPQVPQVPPIQHIQHVQQMHEMQQASLVPSSSSGQSPPASPPTASDNTEGQTKPWITQGLTNGELKQWPSSTSSMGSALNILARAPTMDGTDNSQPTGRPRGTSKVVRIMPRTDDMDRNGGDNMAKKRRSRTIFKIAQTTRLEHVFVQTAVPDRKTKEMLARELGVDYKSVNVWYQNRRQKRRRAASCPTGSSLKQGTIAKLEDKSHHSMQLTE